VGEVDGGHPAGADLALDPVPIRERVGEFADDVDWEWPDDGGS
jgi:hypothetical protein